MQHTLQHTLQLTLQHTLQHTLQLQHICTSRFSQNDIPSVLRWKAIDVTLQLALQRTLQHTLQRTSHVASHIHMQVLPKRHPVGAAVEGERRHAATHTATHAATHCNTHHALHHTYICSLFQTTSRRCCGGRRATSNCSPSKCKKPCTACCRENIYLYICTYTYI